MTRPFGFWDKWIGNEANRPTLYTRHLFHRWRRRVDLHKMVEADKPDCFHTHPAHAFRIILWGGYTEEVYLPETAVTAPTFYFKKWRLGMMGYVAPDFCHRIDTLTNGKSSFSLWFRGIPSAKIRLLGPGWPDHLRNTSGIGPQTF